MTLVKDKPANKSSTGHERKFEALVTHTQRQMVALAYRMLGNLEDARDHAQEAFVRLWKLASWPKGEKAVLALLTRILINLCIDTLRRRRRFRFIAISDEEIEDNTKSNYDPEHVLKATEIHTLIESALLKLKPKQKAIFVLRDIESYAVRETAKIVGCSENNVLVNLHLARKNIRNWLTPYLNK
ncbi:MAG: RNA polymerase sigma factor [bacterium]